MTLNAEEIEWLRDNGLNTESTTWAQWKSLYSNQAENWGQMQRLRKLNCGWRRRELRLLCNNKMSRIQADADAGRIGGVIREIIKKKAGYKMEVIVDGDVCIKDPIKVNEKGTQYFGEWFERIEKERIRDQVLAATMEKKKGKEFEELERTLGVPEGSIQHLSDGFKMKSISSEGEKEGADLSKYVPTLEEFLSIIDRMNPHSTGGISGLTYFMVQKWDERVKCRVYEQLKGYYLRKEIPKGWGDCLLAPIPKVADPTLEDLRPLMLFEVLRKIWTGLIMEKLRAYWVKWGLIDETQHGFMGGKGTHTAIPILINCMETAKDFATDLFLSSWDIKRAFDSLGPEIVIKALKRLHVPLEIAEYLVNMDNTGRVYVRTPHNIELMKNGKLKSEGKSFVRGKGLDKEMSPLRCSGWQYLIYYWLRCRRLEMDSRSKMLRGSRGR
jgi:hypothetical protein